MPFSVLSNIPEGAWIALSALAGSACTLLLGWLNLKTKRDTGLASERAELSHGQRELISILRSEVDSLHAHVADISIALNAERESCDRRMAAMDSKYQAQIAELQRRIGREEQRDA